jgi:hypothetical protein
LTQTRSMKTTRTEKGGRPPATPSAASTPSHHGRSEEAEATTWTRPAPARRRAQAPEQEPPCRLEIRATPSSSSSFPCHHGQPAEDEGASEQPRQRGGGLELYSRMQWSPPSAAAPTAGARGRRRVTLVPRSKPLDLELRTRAESPLPARGRLKDLLYSLQLLRRPSSAAPHRLFRREGLESASTSLARLSKQQVGGKGENGSQLTRALSIYISGASLTQQCGSTYQ